MRLTAPWLGALAAVTAAALAVNVWIAAHRMEGYNYRLAGYASIYHPREAPAVEGFARADGALEVVLSEPPPGGWRVRALDPDAAPPEVLDGRRVRLSGPAAEYAVAPAAGGPEARFRVRPAERLFTSSDLPVGPRERRPLAALAFSPDRYPSADLAEARSLLRAAGVDLDGDPGARLRAVWRHVFLALDPGRGRPADGVRRLPALEQYRRIVAGEATGQCTEHATVLALFATAAGLPARVVDVNRALDRVDLSAHTFCEVFLAEHGRWAYTDVSLNVLAVRDGGGRRLPLNAAQLAHLHEADATSGLVATVLRGGRLVDVPYDEVGELPRAYLNPNATLVFQRQYADRWGAWAWHHRYVVDPEPAYALGGDNAPHWKKLLAYLALVGLGFAWLLVAARAARDRLRRRPAPILLLPAAAPAEDEEARRAAA